MDKEAFLIGLMDSPHIGDDGAVLGESVYSADAFCEGTHFLREWMSPYQIGRKAMLVNLSDAVAMNAEPRYALVMVSIPREMGEEEIAELSRGLRETAAEYGCEIIGGDTVGGERLHLGISLVSHSSDPLPRRGVRPGDLLAYTGSLGQSRRDLMALLEGKKLAADSRFYEPTLRGEFVREARPLLRAGMDLSDGLYCDTNKLLDANGLGLELRQEIPEEIGASGEEYEMLVAFDPAGEEALREVAERTGTPLTIFARTMREGGFRFPCRSHHF
ncbi:thiamine-phosphate kinase [Nitratifractor sp.]